VSSAQLDQQEIDDIAQQLKKGLKGGADTPSAPKGTVETSVVPAIGPQPVAPAPPTPEPVKAPTEGVLHLQRPKAPAPTPDDTIFIDSDGKLHLREAEADSAPKEQ
jgi:hypothetical protein